MNSIEEDESNELMNNIASPMKDFINSTLAKTYNVVENSEGKTSFDEKENCDEKKQPEDYLEGEGEILEVLYNSSSESVRKRQVLRLFERFRKEYDQLSKSLHRSIENEQKLIRKCCDLKSSILINAEKIQLAKRFQEEQMKSIDFHKAQCEQAWAEANSSKQREQEALGLIQVLKEDVIKLKHRLQQAHDQSNQRLNETKTEEGKESLTKGKQRNNVTEPQVMTFSEWKTRNNIWTPDVEIIDAYSPTREMYKIDAQLRAQTSTNKRNERSVTIEAEGMVRAITASASTPSLAMKLPQL